MAWVLHVLAVLLCGCIHMVQDKPISSHQISPHVSSVGLGRKSGDGLETSQPEGMAISSVINDVLNKAKLTESGKESTKYLCSRHGRRELARLTKSLDLVDMPKHIAAVHRKDTLWQDGLQEQGLGVHELRKQLRHLATMCRVRHGKLDGMIKKIQSQVQSNRHSHHAGSSLPTATMAPPHEDECYNQQVAMSVDRLHHMKAQMLQNGCWERSLDDMYARLVKHASNKYHVMGDLKSVPSENNTQRAFFCRFSVQYQQCLQDQHAEANVISITKKDQTDDVKSVTMTPEITRDVEESTTKPPRFPIWDNTYDGYIFY